MENDVPPLGLRVRDRRAFEKETPPAIPRRTRDRAVDARNNRRRVLRRVVFGNAVLAGGNRFEELHGKLGKRKRANVDGPVGAGAAD